jgi:hypothetical protein
MNMDESHLTKRVGFHGPLSDAPSSAVSVGVFGQRLFEFRNKPRSVWLVRASFVGRPHRVRLGTKVLGGATQDTSGS